MQFFFFKIVRLWIVEISGGCKWETEKHQKPPSRRKIANWGGCASAEFAPDGATLVGIDADGVAALWCARSGKVLQRSRKKWDFSEAFLGSCGASIISVYIYTLYRSISQKRIMNRVEGNTWMIPTKGNTWFPFWYSVSRVAMHLDTCLKNGF